MSSEIVELSAAEMGGLHLSAAMHTMVPLTIYLRKVVALIWVMAGKPGVDVNPVMTGSLLNSGGRV